MSRTSTPAWVIARWLYGVFFLVAAIWVGAWLLFGIGSPPAQPTPAAQALTDALSDSGIIDPLLAIAYLVGGLALLGERTAPLGLAILTPAVVVIVAFHLVLSELVPVGLIVTGIHAALTWHYRHRFACLWTAQDKSVRS